MKTLKKILCLSFILIFGFILGSCDNTNNENNDKVVEKLTLVTVNDFHGALDETDNKYGIARLAKNISNVVENSEAAVIISAGDMFQGTALSNYDHGKTTIDIMNKMKFDLMVLGNHEFDWGYSEMYKYIDGDQSNGEANFPFLGCNIFKKVSDTMPNGLKSYQIVERGGLKVGIIGYMGYGNESSISVSMIEDYYFANPLPIVAKLSKQLREEEKVDVVVVVGHEGDESNELFASLPSESRIDAIVNAHSHAGYNGTITRPDGVKIPYVQASSAGKYYGVVELSIDSKTKQVTGGTAATKINAGPKDSSIETIINNLKEETAPIFSRIIGVAHNDINRYGAADWAATALRDFANTDVGVINIGGIRSQAFPIEAGSNITVAKMYEIMPFDNILKTVDLKGSDLRILINDGTLVKSVNVSKNSATGYIYINGEILDDDKVYSVASIDYIFDNKYYPFYKGENQVNTGILFRDILIARVEKDETIDILNRN